jgi:GNAT superfamily N-acetyltransferase
VAVVSYQLAAILHFQFSIFNSPFSILNFQLLSIFFVFSKTLSQGYTLENTRAEHAQELEALQKIVFPTLSPDELMQARHYLNHIRIFPEGQFVLLDGARVVGMTTTIRHRLTEEAHTFLEVSDHLWMNTHLPDGDWLYGMDVGIHPDHRGQGLARELYRARQELCRSLGLRGQIIVGMLNGYGPHAGRLGIEEYFEEVLVGRLQDPTVTAQRRVGFEVLRLITNYLDDPQCGNAGALMVLDVAKKV